MPSFVFAIIELKYVVAVLDTLLTDAISAPLSVITAFSLFSAAFTENDNSVAESSIAKLIIIASILFI